MAKIGTAHVEVKPVLDEEALDRLCERIEQRVRDAVVAGMRGGMAGWQGTVRWPGYSMPPGTVYKVATSTPPPKSANT